MIRVLYGISVSGRGLIGACKMAGGKVRFLFQSRDGSAWSEPTAMGFLQREFGLDGSKALCWEECDYRDLRDELRRSSPMAGLLLED